MSDDADFDIGGGFDDENEVDDFIAEEEDMDVDEPVEEEDGDVTITANGHNEPARKRARRDDSHPVFTMMPPLPNESVWARGAAPTIDPNTHTIDCQNLEADYYLSMTSKQFPGYDDPYSLGQTTKRAVVRIFGVDSLGRSVLIHAHNFLPYFYIAAWPGFNEREDHRLLGEKLNEELKAANRADKSMTRPVLGIEVVQRQSIWGYHTQATQTFLKIIVALPPLVPTARRILERGIHLGEKYNRRMFSTYESNLPFVLRFMVDLKLTGAGWLSVPCGRQYTVRSGAERASRCQIEIDCDYRSIVHHDSEGEWLKLAPMRILSFDIECAGRQGHFPHPEHDPVIQIACCLSSTHSISEPFAQIVFTLKGCSPIVGATVISSETESELLMKFLRFWLASDPDLITGYNFINFDLPYLLDRAKTLKLGDFPYFGRVLKSVSTMKNSKFESKAYGIRENKEIKMEGRIQVDCLDVIRREYKLRSYTLNSVSAHFLGQQKEDVHYSIISDLQNGNDETRHRLAVYCLKDSQLPLRLIDSLMIVINLMEMARVTGVPVAYLLTRGQQIKVVSQLYRAARKHSLVIPIRESRVTEEKYEGATVIEPKKAYYTQPIATLDFASLYPSIMMAHNLCYSTLVAPADVANMPPDSYVKTPTGDYFVKKEVKQGLLPEILTELLQARALTKKQMKQATDPSVQAVLNGRQLALKISANCFPTEDHEVLTANGFLSLASIQAHFKENATLDVACFVNGALQYHPITVADVTVARGSFELVCFEAQKTDGECPRSNGVSLRVTNNHRMWLRLGPTWTNRVWPFAPGQSQDEVAPPFTICAAGDVAVAGARDASVAAQFTAAFSSGLDTSTTSPPFVTALNLQGADEIDAFLQLYGYWLSAGWLDYSSQALAFSPSKSADSEFLSSLFDRLHFRQLTAEQREPGANGAFVAPELTEKAQRANCEAWVHQRAHYIYVPCWWQYFAAQYGHKYATAAGRKIAMAAAKRRCFTVSAPPLSTVKSLTQQKLPAATPFGRARRPSASFIEARNRTVNGVAQHICYSKYCQLAGRRQPLTAFGSRSHKDSGSKALAAEGKCKQCMSAISKRFAATKTKLAGAPVRDGQLLDAEIIDSAKWFWFWAWKLNKHQLRQLLIGLRVAVGDTASGERTGFAISTYSRRFAEEIIRIATHAGFTALLQPRVEPGKSQSTNSASVKIVAPLQGWVVNCSELTREAQPKITVATETHTEAYTGTVWCVSVPVAPHLIMVRRLIKQQGLAIPARAVIVGNSVYGFTGAQVGQLPCLAISSSVTGFGRVMIENTKAAVEKRFTKANGYQFDADVVYGDTDSVMVRFGTDNVAEAMRLGAEAAAHVTQQFINPIKLEFEKVYYPYLLMNKKRYAGLYWTNPDQWDKMDTKGIETVRRDNCALVSNVVTSCLNLILIEKRPEAAIEYVKRTIADLLCNRLDLSLLVISKSLGKSASSEGYVAKQAHVELAERMRKRDPRSAPAVGDRVAYVITKAARGVPAYDRAEDPIYVLENSIPIDANHYLTNQLQQPLQRIFEPILTPTQLKSLFAGDHTRQIKVSTPMTGGIMKFAVKTKTCLGCKVPLSKSEGEFCAHCEERKPIIYFKQLEQVREHEELFARTWTQCQSCQGSLHMDVLCTSRDCPIFYRRKKVQKDLDEAQRALERFGF